MTEAHHHPRFVEGRSRLATVVRLLLAENDLSHADLEAFYRWACPETPTWLNKSQVSTLRNAKLPKPGPQLFDALAQINLRMAQLAGNTSPMVQALDDRGPLPSELKHLRDGAFWVPNPQTNQPMDVGDLFRVYVGRLELSGSLWEELPEVYTDAEAAQISGHLGLWFQQRLLKDGKTLLEGNPLLMELYPAAKDAKRLKRLQLVLGGHEVYTSKDLNEERDALRFLTGKLERGSAFSVREFDRWCHHALPPRS